MLTVKYLPRLQNVVESERFKRMKIKSTGIQKVMPIKGITRDLFASRVSSAPKICADLETKGISAESAEVVIAFRRKGSLSNYESTWRKWSSWCVGK